MLDALFMLLVWLAQFCQRQPFLPRLVILLASLVLALWLLGGILVLPGLLQHAPLQVTGVTAAPVLL